MSTMEIGQALVGLCNEGKDQDVVERFYGDDIVSIEGQGGEEMPQRAEGIAAVRAKGEWWFANHEMHGVTAEGPYVGHRADQFAVRFLVDVTPGGGERMQMDEVALYTVKDGKIVQEEFLYRVG